MLQVDEKWLEERVSFYLLEIRLLSHISWCSLCCERGLWNYVCIRSSYVPRKLL